MKYKTKDLIRLILIISFIIIPTFPIGVNAAIFEGHICEHGYHTFGDYQMGYGVGNYGKNRRYYYASGFDSNHMKYIEDAVYEWVHTSQNYPYVKTSISIRETTNKESALFEFRNNFLGDKILGQTRFYLYQNEVPLINGTLTKNYGWAVCTISVSEMDKNNITAVNRQGTIAHELGHAMGLSHQNRRPESIMCQTKANRTATRADALDCNTINHIYG